MTATTAPSDRLGREAVDEYMRHKGYGHLSPVGVSRLDDQPCWYFLYELEDGEVEIEVVFEDGEWRFFTDWLG